MTSTNATKAVEAARELNASDPLPVGFPDFDAPETLDAEGFPVTKYHVGDLVGVLHGPLRPREIRKARVQINSHYRADFPVNEILWNLVPNGDGTYSEVAR